MFRFADDFVACFEYRHEAAAFERALPARLAQYGLEVVPDKTKMLRFGRNGGRYNGRFGFLGFEFRWEPDRKGGPTVKRRTARKKLQAAVKRMGTWLRTRRHWKLPPDAGIGVQVAQSTQPEAQLYVASLLSADGQVSDSQAPNSRTESATVERV